MLKKISRLEHKIGDRIFHLLCESDSPLYEVKDSLFEFLKFIGKIEDAELEKQKEQGQVDKKDDDEE